MASCVRGAESAYLSWVPRFGFASIYPVVWADQTDDVGRGGAGRTMTDYVRCGASEGEVDFAEMISAKSSNPWLVFAYERTGDEFVVALVRVSSEEVKRRMYMEEAFLDRGVRKLLEAEARVAVTSAATVRAWLGESRLEGSRLTYVGNTGRCGSTLMHKLMLSCGVCSLSEPHWLDQLVRYDTTKSATLEELKSAVELCTGLDMELAARSAFPEATAFSLNPKSAGSRVQLAVAEAYPESKHLFMYRACYKVTESFGSIFAKKFSRVAIALAGVRWSLAPSYDVPPKLAPLLEPFDLDAAFKSLSSRGAVGIVLRWLDAVLGWLQIAETLGPRAAVVRMDEFVGPDKAAVATQLLAHLGVPVADPTFAVFNENSQKGSGMTNSSNQNKAASKFLCPADLDAIRERILSPVFADAAGVALKGNDVILPGSLGVAES